MAGMGMTLTRQTGMPQLTAKMLGWFKSSTFSVSIFTFPPVVNEKAQTEKKTQCGENGISRHPILVHGPCQYLTNARK